VISGIVNPPVYVNRTNIGSVCCLIENVNVTGLKYKLTLAFDARVSY